MALTPAERQRIRREKLKKQGTTRRDWILEPEELRMLSEICEQRRPGRDPYSENEVIGLLIRKNHRELQKSLTRKCERCGQIMPVQKCLFDGESSCLLTTIRPQLAIKV